MRKASKSRQRWGTTLGVLFLLVGIPGLVLPFVQGILFIALGLAFLSTFSPGAGRVIGGWKSRNPFLALHLDRAENRIERWSRLATHRLTNARIEGYAGRTLALQADVAKEPGAGVAIVLHGLGGYKEQPVIRALVDSFADLGMSVVRFDAANSVGESSGSYHNGTATSFIRDLATVVEWTERQPWKGETPAWLAGHSLGGLCVLEYAAQHGSRIAGVAAIGAVISGALSREAYELYRPAEWNRWQREGFREDRVPLRAPKNRLPFSHMEDRLAYDLTQKAHQITTPVLLLVGEEDHHTPPEHQREFYLRLRSHKRLSVLPGAPHAPIAHADLDTLKDELSSFIRQFSENQSA